MSVYPLGEGQRNDPAHDLAIKSVEKEAFIVWLATPRMDRKPGTQRAFAAEYDVSEQTLRNWKKDARVVSQVRALVGRSVAMDDLADIIDALKATALDPENPRSVSAAKTLIDLIDKTYEAHEVVPLADMSIDDLKALAASLYDEFDERSQTQSA